jgi:hypothetical protein
VGNAERIEENLMPQKVSEGKDEMNLAEFPLCALSRRPRPDQKTLRFEDRLFDKGKGEWITRQLTVTGSDAFGLPTALDDEVLLGLIQLTRQRDFADRKVPFTRHELLKLLDWSDDSKNYRRLESSLNRWTGVTLYYQKAWWNKARQCWVDEKFHVLDNVWLCHRGEPPPDTGLDDSGALVSAFVWNEVIFRSFHAGNLKSIDFEFFKSIKSAVARRLYRFLDKRFWHCDRREFDLRELCCEHIGLSRSYDMAGMKRKLLPGIEELEERGFIRLAPTTGRFAKLRRGQWTVVFQRAGNEMNTGDAAATGSPLAVKLVERGVTAKAAESIVAKFPPDRVAVHIAIFDRLMKNRDAKVSRNPAGYLVSSIKDNYAAPKELSATEKAPVGKNRQKNSAEKFREKTDDTSCARLEAVAAFWASLSTEERMANEAHAIASAGKFEKKLIERGGILGEVARKNVLTAYALNRTNQPHFS